MKSRIKVIGDFVNIVRSTAPGVQTVSVYICVRSCKSNTTRWFVTVSSFSFWFCKTFTFFADGRRRKNVCFSFFGRIRIALLVVYWRFGTVDGSVQRIDIDRLCRTYNSRCRFYNGVITEKNGFSPIIFKVLKKYSHIGFYGSATVDRHAARFALRRVTYTSKIEIYRFVRSDSKKVWRSLNGIMRNPV